MADQGPMTITRPIFLAFVILLLLPWGAYFSGPVAAAQPSAAQAMQQQIFGAETQTLIAPQKTCRNAVLPGAPCGPDLAIPAMSQPLFMAKVAANHPIYLAILGQGRTPAPSRGPPRAA